MPKEVSVKISRAQFWAVTVLLLLLPIASKYKLLILGERTEGVVVAHEKVSPALPGLDGHDTFAVIEFRAGSKVIKMYGPENFAYSLGDRLTVYYNREHPKECMVLNLAALYASSHAIIPWVLLLLWIAFYSAFRDKGC